MMIHPFLDRLGMTLPIIQAPMAGTSTPALAAAVSNAGGLGSIPLGAVDAAGALAMIAATRAATTRPFNANLFCHAPAMRDAVREAAWLDRLAPVFHRFGAEPPAALDTGYRSFVEDDAMLRVLVEAKPRVVSFHFGLPPADRIAALRQTGAVLLATATNLAEARAIVAAGGDAVIAQGYEAGGHRGMFDPDAIDDRLSTAVLTERLADALPVPVIAAGGIMTGAGIAACLALGAAAAQLGTAFIGCPESQADAAFRDALFGEPALHTAMTRVISGRPARCLANGFTALARSLPEEEAPAYPVAYSAGRALAAAARATGDGRYAPQLAGQGAPLARALSAADLIAALAAEMKRPG